MGIKTIGRFVYDSTTATAITADGAVPLPASTTSTNCVSCDGYNININRSGVYQIIGDFTFAATATGAVETQMYRNGNALAGAHALSTVATVGDFVSQTINSVITVPCNAPTATINFKAIDATSVRVANVVIIKVA